jgi:hypothetical protein
MPRYRHIHRSIGMCNETDVGPRRSKPYTRVGLTRDAPDSALQRTSSTALLQAGTLSVRMIEMVHLREPPLVDREIVMACLARKIGWGP